MLAEHCILVMFSVPAQWMEWKPWTACSRTCGPGATREKSRIFVPGRNGAPNRPRGNLKEIEDCSTSTIPDWPTCPEDALYGEWESWSPCTETCYEKGTQIPLKTRRRKCIKAIPSTNAAYNTDLVTCKDLPQIEPETDHCTICPGDMELWILIFP